MRNIPLYAVGGLLIFWLVGGSYWYNQHYCSAGNNIPTSKPAIIYIEDELNEIAKAPAPEFRFNQIQPLLSTQTVIALQRLSDYLRQNPDRSLMLTGYSDKTEENDKTGILRAEAISALLVSLGAPQTSIQTVAANKGRLQFENGYSSHAISLAFQPNEGSHPGFMPLNLYFKIDRYQVISNRALEEYCDQLRQFLSAKPELVVSITGFEDSDEAGSGSLSRKRARALGTFLLRTGIKAKQIKVVSEAGETPDQKSNKNRRAEIRIIRV